MLFKKHSRIHYQFDTPKVIGLNRYEIRKWGDDEEKQTQTTSQTQTMQPQDYAESTGARQNWWNTLQDWQKGGSYGVNLPNYENVYKNAANRINQYYWGSPSGGGLIDKIRAGAARRGVAESPTVDVLTQRMGAEQAGQLGDISTNLDVTKANAVEQARTNWLSSLMNLSGLKSGAYTSTGTGTSTLTQPSNALSDLIGSGVGMLGSFAMGNYLGGAKNDLDMFSDIFGTGKTQSSLTDRGVTNAFTNYEPNNWMSSMYNY